MKKNHMVMIIGIIILAMVACFELGAICQANFTSKHVIKEIEKVEVPVTVPVEKVVIKEKYTTHPQLVFSQKEMNQLLQKKIDSIQIGVNPKHLRRIIENTLIYLEVPKEELSKWIELLMITSQIESDLCYNLKQVKGPARGPFQVEPNTEKDLWERIIKKNPNLEKKIRSLRCEAHLGIHELEYNWAYATALSYIYYKDRAVNPVTMSTFDMVVAHKKHYNTFKGASTIKKSLTKLAGSHIL